MENITIEQAEDLIRKNTKTITSTETLPLLHARGRILAGDRKASFDNPPYHRSLVDGYACKLSDVENASPDTPAILEVVREIDAGQYSTEEIQKGQAVRIMTGAALPPGCGCCVRQEDSDYGEKQVRIFRPGKAWGNCGFKGDDFKKGSLLLKKGSRIGFAEAGILAGMGHAEVSVFRLPRAAVFTTGDELVPPGQPLPPGKIYNSNQALLTARLLEFGAELVCMESVPDSPSAMAESLKKASKNADVIFTTGAVSSGKKDIMHEALARIGAKRIFWRVMARPGGPTLFSVYQDIPILSLSGSPFGVSVMTELMARPLLQQMKQDDSLKLVRVQGALAEPFDIFGKGRRFVWACWEQGILRLPRHGGSALASMAGCNCLLDVNAEGHGLKKGHIMEAVLL